MPHTREDESGLPYPRRGQVRKLGYPADAKSEPDLVERDGP